MERLVIKGGFPLSGDVVPAGNKNAALPILAATLLTDCEVTLHNVPRIGDVATILQLLTEIGVTVRDEGDTLHLCARDARFSRPRPELFQQVRGGMLLAGPMLSRFGQAIMPLPGGDRIGRRRVDTHLLALEALGARDRLRSLRLCHADRRAARRGHPARRGQRDRHRERRDGGGAGEGHHHHPQRRLRAARAGLMPTAQLPGRPNRGDRHQHADDSGSGSAGRRRVHHLARLS